MGFTATRTMRAAQTLYEGVDIAGHGTMGLITYMRTDSLRISDEAVAAAKEYIAGAYGEAYICPYKRTWKTKSATAAQDAHEAIRPSVPSLTPDEVDKSISGDTAKLYRMIWSRFMASQMADCQQDTVSVTVSAADYRFKASGYTVTFDGFTVLYEEATDEKEKKETALPPLEQGQVLKLRDLKSEQKFTQPPARYTEATLIKALEENGIGRPSTYAPIITTIIDRGYVERDQKKLKPTLLGRAVDGLMLEQFPHIVDVDFSAQMEKNLDKIESGKADWHKTVDDFYQALRQASSRPKRTWKARRSRCRTSLPVRYATCAAGPWSSRWASTASSWPAAASRSAGAQSGWSRIPAASAQVRQGPYAGAQKLQGPHLLWLRALPGLRLYDMGHAGAHQVPQVRQHHVPQRLQAVLRKGRLRLRDAGAEEGLINKRLPPDGESFSENTLQPPSLAKAPPSGELALPQAMTERVGAKEKPNERL